MRRVAGSSAFGACYVFVACFCTLTLRTVLWVSHRITHTHISFSREQRCRKCVCPRATSQQPFSSTQIGRKLLEKNDRHRHGQTRSSNNNECSLFFALLNILELRFCPTAQIGALRTSAYGFPAAIAISNIWATWFETFF